MKNKELNTEGRTDDPSLSISDVDIMGEFDASGFDSDIIGNLIDLVSDILTREFTDIMKRKVVQYGNRLNFCCPYCSDSELDRKKKRGNIYTDTMYYICFNCDKRVSVVHLLSDFKSLNSVDYRKYTVRSKSNRGGRNSTKSIPYNLILPEYIHNYLLSKKVVMDYAGFISIEGTQGEHFLRNRLHKNLDRFAWNPKYEQLVIFNQDDTGDNIIGYQLRNCNPHAKIKYLNKTYDEIRKESGYPDIENTDRINKLVTQFNVLNVDYSKPIIVTEGALDCFLLDNAISTGSVLRLPMVDIGMYYYMFDYDKSGRDKLAELLAKDQTVFMWKKYLSDNGIEWSINKKLDWNQLLILLWNSHRGVPGIMKYFTNNVWDMMEI